MRIKNRLSPYPILDNFGDDYVDSSFNVEYEVNTQFTEIYGKLIFEINNDEIKQLIAEHKAVYTVHIESPTTCFRRVLSSDDTEIEFRVTAASVKKVIEIRTFIVLTQEVKGFYSKKFHPDYQGQTFDLEAHQIIAIGTAKDYEIKKDDRDFESLPSILRIVKSEDRRKGTLSVNTDNDEYVIIGLSEETFKLYANLGKSSFKATAFSLVLLPALIVIIQRMCDAKDDTAVNSMHWFKVIENLLNNNGIHLNDISIDNDSLLSTCQKIFAKQIYKSENDLEETDEFQKANYRLRTITVDENGTPTQDMSFSAFDFDGLLKENNWTESIVYDEMVDSKFLLVIFSKNAEGQEILNNALIWYIPKKDVNKVKDVWKEARKVIKNGIKLQQKLSHDKAGRLIFVYENNFPKSSFNKVAHVRNKAGESEYFCENANSVKLKNPAEVITLKEIPAELKDTPIPTGEYMTKQCFWFNKKYMKQQIKDFIKSY